MNGNTVAIIATLAALIGPLLAFLATSKKMSGKIGTSDADKLWDEAERQREDYRQRIERSDKRVAALEMRVDSLEGLNRNLRQENFDHESTIQKLNDRVESLEKENTKLKEQIVDLQAQLTRQQRNG